MSIKTWCNKNHTTCFIDKCCGYDWTECSKDHDDCYEKQYTNKEKCDSVFFKCLKHKVNIVFGGIAWFLVRAGGYIAGWNKYKKESR